jgi:hypothetical protein
MSTASSRENFRRHVGTEWVRTAHGPWHESHYRCKSRNDTFKIVAVTVAIHPPSPTCAFCKKRHK